MNCVASNKTLTDNIKVKQRELVIRVLTIAIAATAFDKCGLCKNTVEKLLLGAVNQADSINKGYVKLADIEQMLKEEYDFQIHFTGDDK